MAFLVASPSVAALLCPLNPQYLLSKRKSGERDADASPAKTWLKYHAKKK